MRVARQQGADSRCDSTNCDAYGSLLDQQLPSLCNQTLREIEDEASDDDLIGVDQGAQEVVESTDIIQDSVASQVASVDQDIAIQNLEGAVQSVGVADGYEFHKLKLP